MQIPSEAEGFDNAAATATGEETQGKIPVPLHWCARSPCRARLCLAGETLQAVMNTEGAA
jgi:hypothetical protein